jgi:prepilin-type N-terminal cleavage/methylation domain-containing protein/prepilin-type processing-associated H-X9-DG protein
VTPRAAFSLIELLVVIAIIAVLASLLLPTITLVRSAALTVGCGANQRQILLGVMAYSDEQEGFLPCSFDGGRYYPYTARVGQYLDLQSSGAGAINTWQGAWRIMRCGANTQTQWGLSYGLNHYFCPDTTNASPIINQPKQLASFTRPSQIMLSTDVANEGRIYIYTPLKVYSDLKAAPVWASGGSLQPFLPVQRHRGGLNCGFLDGHVRWSPNLAIEDQAQTILLRDNAGVH